MGYKILTIGSIHGEEGWKSVGDIQTLLDSMGQATPSYDAYVFLGDYTDSFWVNSTAIVSNLKSIIELWDYYQQHVILLLGNHDMQYFYERNEHLLCTGYRPETYDDLHYLFTTNGHAFHIGYSLGNYLWTHAGINNAWAKEWGYDSLSASAIENKLNTDWQNAAPWIFQVGELKGGMHSVGGPLWQDTQKLIRNPINNQYKINQIVGSIGLTKPEFYQINGAMIHLVNPIAKWDYKSAAPTEREPIALSLYVNA